MENLKIKRAPGANIKISFNSNEYPFKFIIANERLDWHFFDFSCWFIRKISKIDHYYFFSYRRDYIKLKNVIKDNQKLRECLISLSEISTKAIDFGASIYCYYKVGKVIITLPNLEWWRYQNLMDDFEDIKKWCNVFF